MLKNVKIGGKLAFGFGMLIMIMGILGFVSIFQMRGVRVHTNRVDRELIPQVEGTNNVERNSLMTMYNMRAYSLTGEDEYLKQGRTYLGDMKESLNEAMEHANRYEDLTVLRESTDKAMGKAAEYEKLADEIESLTVRIEKNRGVINEKSDVLVGGLVKYLAAENELLAKEIKRSGARNTRALYERVSKLGLLTDLISLSSDVASETFRAQAERDITVARDAMKNFDTINTKLEELRSKTSDASGKQLLAATQAASDEYKTAMDDLLLSWSKLDNANVSFEKAGKDILTASDEAAKAGMDDMKKISKLSVSKLSQASMIMIVGLAVGIVIGILLAVFLARGITGPVVKGVEFAETIADGDLTARLDIKQKDEIGQLANALNKMADNLKDMTLQIQDGATQIASSSEELSATAQQLAEGAQNQASTLEETSASVEELTASVEQVADHAQSQTAAVEESSASMDQIQKSIDEVTKTLQEVSQISTESVAQSKDGAETVGKAVDAINLISESSNKIAGIINVISDIADQTNLLALNASIEAARAGEHGRGFAVVADEVSKLADRSAASTKEIESLIKESVENVQKGVKLAQESKISMEQITGGAQKSADMINALAGAMEQQVNAFKEMAKAVESINEMSQSISAATEEQTTNAKQTSKAVESVNEITQQAASAAEEMASSTEELSAMAQQLQGLVSQFKLDSNSSSLGDSTTRTLPEPVKTSEKAEEEADEVADITLKEDAA